MSVKFKGNLGKLMLSQEESCILNFGVVYCVSEWVKLCFQGREVEIKDVEVISFMLCKAMT